MNPLVVDLLKYLGYLNHFEQTNMLLESKSLSKSIKVSIKQRNACAKTPDEIYLYSNLSVDRAILMTDNGLCLRFLYTIHEIAFFAIHDFCR